jgi:hypothetical protein
MEKIISTCLRTKIRAAITIIGVLASLFGVISGFNSAAAWADERYAHAADVNRRLDIMQQDSLTSRRQQLDDKIFELKLQKRTAAIQALIERYTNQMRALDEQIANMVDSTNATANGTVHR